MAQRPALRKDAAGTLTYTAPEGTIEASPAPTVTLYDETGTQYTATSPTITRSGATLTITVPAALLDNWGDNYRATWTYTVGTTAYTRHQTFECVTSVLSQTLTAANLTAKYAFLLGSRLPPKISTAQPALDDAWDEMLDLVLSMTGRTPHLIVDPIPLERAHAHFAAACIARNLSAGSARGGDNWQQTAAQLHEMATDLLDRALNVCRWYDRDSDLMPDGSGSFYGHYYLDRNGQRIGGTEEQNAIVYAPRLTR